MGWGHLVLPWREHSMWDWSGTLKLTFVPFPGHPAFILVGSRILMAILVRTCFFFVFWEQCSGFWLVAERKKGLPFLFAADASSSEGGSLVRRLPLSYFFSMMSKAQAWSLGLENPSFLILQAWIAWKTLLPCFSHNKQSTNHSRGRSEVLGSHGACRSHGVCLFFFFFALFPFPNTLSRCGTCGFTWKSPLHEFILWSPPTRLSTHPEPHHLPIHIDPKVNI